MKEFPLNKIFRLLCVKCCAIDSLLGKMFRFSVEQIDACFHLLLTLEILGKDIKDVIV